MSDKICVWKYSSSDKDTGKPSFPDRCKERKCKGEFKPWEKPFPCFHPILEEKIQAAGCRK